MERVDYFLEYAQWMGSNGVPSADISTLLQKALHALQEVEDQNNPAKDNAPDDSELGDAGDATSAGVSQAKSKGTLSRTGTGLRGGAGSTAASRTNTQRGTRSVGAASAATSEPKLGPDGKPIEEEKLPPRLDFKMLEQCARVLVMQSMLEGSEATQTAKYLEAVSYLQKSLTLWMDTLYPFYRKQAYAALKPEQRGECPFPPPEIPKGMNKQQAADYAAMLAAQPPPVTYPTLESYNPPKPDFLAPPEDPILFITWLNAAQQPLVDLMVLGVAQHPDDVPSKESLSTIQLTAHYFMVLAEGLRRVGHSKAALFVYCYLRMLLLYLKPGVTGTSAVLSAVHFASFTLLMEMGLPAEAHALPQMLPPEPIAPGADPNAKPPPPQNIGTFLSKVISTHYSIPRNIAVKDQCVMFVTF